MPIVNYTPKPDKFYDAAYERSEKRLLKSARKMEGLEAEIAVLRRPTPPHRPLGVPSLFPVPCSHVPRFSEHTSLS